MKTATLLRHELTARQTGAILFFLTLLVAFAAGMIARRKVSPTWKAALEDEVLAEAETPSPPTDPTIPPRSGLPVGPCRDLRGGARGG